MRQKPGPRRRGGMMQEPFSDDHLYRSSAHYDVNDNETKQIRMPTVTNFPM